MNKKGELGAAREGRSQLSFFIHYSDPNPPDSIFLLTVLRHSPHTAIFKSLAPIRLRISFVIVWHCSATSHTEIS